MLDKSKLGQRIVCHECGTKYYDLNRPTPKCPECEADPTLAPARDIASLLASNNRSRPIVASVPASKPEPSSEIEEIEDVEDIDEIDDMDEDDMGSFGSMEIEES